jgi:hypothetical protein
MPARERTVLFLAFLALAPLPASARVHRRSVGPVILDLGPLPPAPAPPGASQPSAETSGAPAVPQAEAPAETPERMPVPVDVGPIYPSHAQPLGALVLTMNVDFMPENDSADSILSLHNKPDAPALIAYYYPTFVADRALLDQPMESPSPPADANAKSGGDATIDQPLPHLRRLVIWIWRLLFLIGLVALIQLFQRYRAGVRNRAAPALSPEAGTETQTVSSDLALSRLQRTTRISRATGSDSLSLMTGKPTAPEKPETESRAFGLIEPGAASPAVTGAETPLIRKRPQRQAPS